jgi:hypothetical protein
MYLSRYQLGMWQERSRLADCLRAVRTLVVRDWVHFWAAGDAATDVQSRED